MEIGEGKNQDRYFFLYRHMDEKGAVTSFPAFSHFYQIRKFFLTKYTHKLPQLF